MGGNRNICLQDLKIMYINPRDGGAIVDERKRNNYAENINPRDGGAIDQDYVGRFHYNRKR